MGQKTNPNILRIGLNKTWKTEFFERKKKELPIYIFKDLEIKDYIKRIFEKQGLIVHDYKAFYTQSLINIYVSYLITPSFSFSGSKENKKIKLTYLKKKKKKVKLISTKLLKKYAKNILRQDHNKLNNNTYKTKKNKLINKNCSVYKLKKYYNTNINRNILLTKNSNLTELKKKQYLKTFDNKNLNQIKLENITKKIFESLSLYTKKKFNIILTFNCINKDIKLTKKQTQTFKEKIMSLQKFKNLSFFKEGINATFETTCNNESSTVLTKFIKLQLKTIKRHKLLFSFLKKTLSLFIETNFSKIKGVQIKIKGRLNGAPRAKHKIINVGDVPIHTFSSKVYYSQETVHNSNGSYGIKVWTVNK